MPLITKYRRLIDVVWLMLLAAYVVIGVPFVPFHGDESTQIFMSHDYAYQFIQRDLDLVRFRDDAPSPDLQYLRLINGSINKYTMGLAWHLAGYSDADVNDQWDWGADWDYNVANHHAPLPGLLLAARYPSAILTALSVAALFALGYAVGGRPVAYIASLYYALNPAILLNGRRAMMEGSLLLFGLLAVLLGVWFLRRPSWWRAMLLGAVSGFALAAKHTNLFVVGAVFFAIVLYPLLAQMRRVRVIRESPLQTRGFILYLILAGLLLIIVFAALNPVWWGGNPLEHTLLILRLRSELLAGQTDTFDGYSGTLDQFAGFGRSAFIVYPQYFEVPNWSDWLADQITRYESTPWRGVSIGGSTIGALILLMLTLVGAWTTFRNANVSLEARWIVGVWGAVMLLTTLLLTPIEWQRYYLPVFPVVGLFGAVGFMATLKYTRKFISF